MYIKSRISRSTDRALTLLALICVAAFEYGPRILLICAAAAVTAMTAELICLYLRGIPFRLKHLDAAVAGVLTVMLMPQTVSVSLVIMSVIVTIIIGRQLFGGREHPVIPAPAVGFCFALLNNRAEMTTFPSAKEILPIWNTSGVSICESVTPIWNRTGDFSDDVFGWLTGFPAQPIGTGSILLLAVIAAVLLFRRSASLSVFLPMMAVLISGSIALNHFHHPAASAVGCCLTNQTLFAVLYLYCDFDYAPPHLGGVLYGMLSGMLILLLTRTFYIMDAPVLLSILLTPVALVLNEALRGTEDSAPLSKGGNGQYA